MLCDCAEYAVYPLMPYFSGKYSRVHLCEKAAY